MDLSVASPGMTPQELVPEGGQVSVRIVVRKRALFYLVVKQINETASVQTFTDYLCATRDEVLNRGRLLKLADGIFRENTFSLATLSTFRNIEPIGGAVLEVGITAPEPCFELNRPGLVDDTEPFAALQPNVLTGSSVRQVVVIESKLKKRNVLVCAAVAILIAVLSGILLGVLTGNPGYGIGFGFGIVGTVAFLVQLSIWATE
ncbi:hypothetical protein F5Y18DRAFT_433618 [Xylariaceae sp. FL1019]|nr:hypothetical protein F5Y18DRAFT_433618 [Xylariaceae sp. FL1019]